MASRYNEYVKRRWQALIEEFGGCCTFCAQRWDLEFAHTRPTKCVGKSRGKSRRLMDILRHSDKYILLCKGCHAEFDGRPRPRRGHEQTRHDE